MNDLFICILVFVYGLVLGSFFNVIGLRWAVDEKITGRSKCPNCGTVLHAKNLIPVFSFIAQGGKCHNCKEHISFIYPVMELLTAISYLFIYLNYGFNIEFFIGIIFMSVLLISGVTDFKEGIVLDKIVIPPTLLMLIVTIISDPNNIFFKVIPSFIVFMLLLIAVNLKKLGGGDVLIISDVFLVHGILFGSLTMFFTSMITLICMLIYKKNNLPFIPFWVLGNIITYIIIFFI